MSNYNKITALYSRLSVGDEDRDGGESNSIQNQKIFLENYARGQHLTNIRHYIDDDESGRFFDRSAYSRMMDDVENGKIGVCIMKDLTRWGRDYLQVGNAMEIFRRNNVRFIAVNNGIDSEKPDTLEFAPFINIMSEWYAKDISKKVKTGIKTKGMSGKPIVTEAPYGYVKDPDNKDFWIIDEEAAEVVRLIFRLFIGGKNRNQIAVYLTQEQIPTPTFYMKDRGRGTCKNKTLNEDNRCKWNKATLTNILTRQEYCGDVVNFKTTKHFRDKHNHYVDRSQWHITENVHEPIISRSDFETVQRILENAPVRRPNGDGEIHPLSGLLFCKDCGAKMHIRIDYRNGGKRHVAYCSEYHKGKAKNPKCSSPHIMDADLLNHIIINAVSFYDYKKLRTVPYRTAQQIRSISDRLCMESQLSVIKDPQQLGQLYPTYIQKKRTTSNRTEVRKKLNFCLERATNYAQFLQMAQELGIFVCQRGKHMTYLPEGAGRAIRDTSLADTDKFTYTGLVERLEDNAAEQLFIYERIAKILPNVSTFADFVKLLQSEGVKIRVKKQSGQLLYKAADLDGTWIPADALGDGFTLAGLESAIKNKSGILDTNHSTPIAELYQELTTNYPQSCDTSVRLTSRQICSAGKRGVLLQIHDSSGNPAKLMIDNSHIHTTPDGSVSGDIGAAFSYDITYDDGTHGTIRGTDLIRQIDEENLTQPLIVSLTADQIMTISLRGVTVHLPQYHIERLFIPERYVQRNVEQGSCAISLYPGWQYSYVPIGSENTRKSISGAELAQSLGGVVQVGTSESSLARRVANVERRAGIANAQELGKLLGSMADNGLHSAADFDKQISTYQREEMKFRNKIAELRSKSKIYASTAHNLQACRTYKSVWLEYASKPLAQKDTFYKQNEAALQAYSRAASQLDGMGISQLVEPERIQRLVSETENRITELVAELEKVQNADNGMQEDKERVKQIQSNEINGTYSAFSRA